MVLKKTIFVIISVALVCGFAATAFSFNEDTRAEMVDDAAEFCPPALKSYLEGNQEILDWGMGYASRWERYRLNPLELETVYQALVSDLKSGKLGEYQTAKRFGVLACYAAEIIYPGALFGYGESENFVPDQVVYQGYSGLPDFGNRISYLMERYRRTYWQNSDPETVQLLYQASVNEIVDLWVSAWKEAGLDISGVAERGAVVGHDIIRADK